MKTFDSKWFCSFIFLFFLYINQHHISSTLTAPVQEPGGWDRGEGGEEGGSPQLWSCFRFLCARQVDRLPSAYSHGSLALCVCVSRGVRVCDTWRVPPPLHPFTCSSARPLSPDSTCSVFMSLPLTVVTQDTWSTVPDQILLTFEYNSTVFYS